MRNFSSNYRRSMRGICIVLASCLITLVGCGGDNTDNDTNNAEFRSGQLASTVECDEIRELMEVVDSDERREVLAEALAECNAAEEAGRGPEDTPRTRVDHCVQIYQMLDVAANDAEVERIRIAYEQCIESQRPDSDGAAVAATHCDQIAELMAEVRASGDEDLYRSYEARYYACIAADQPSTGPLDHCYEFRRLAANTQSDEERERYVAAYYECVDSGVEVRPVPSDECELLLERAAEARESGDAELYERYINAYDNCIDNSDECVSQCTSSGAASLCAREDALYCAPTDRPQRPVEGSDNSSAEEVNRPDDSDNNEEVVRPGDGEDTGDWDGGWESGSDNNDSGQVSDNNDNTSDLARRCEEIRAAAGEASSDEERERLYRAYERCQASL